MQITIPTGFKVTPQQFDQIAEVEEINKLELTASGELIVMPPTGGDTGRKNSDLNYQIVNWSKQNGMGVCFDSSTLFILPNGARRSPDVSWLLKSRWNQLSAEEQRKFPPIAPDFVIELVSPSDTLPPRYKELQLKMTSDPAPSYGARERARMQEYIDNGVRLGWLINPDEKVVEICRSNQPKEIVSNPTVLSGENVLPGFTLDLSEIF